MAADWRSLARAARLQLEGDRVRVELPRHRSHLVRIEEHPDAWRIWAKSTREAGEDDSLHLLVWSRNRGESLVSLRIDERGHLLGETWVPVAGATADEFAEAVLAVAVECDRMEFVRTGKDLL